MKKILKKKEGFTLVELIVVIAILAILAAVAIPAYSGYITKAKDAAVLTDLDALLTNIQGANAKGSAVTKIVVTSTTATITATTFADDFLANYKLFADDSAATFDAGVLTFGTSAPTLTDTSYASGATWENGTWK